MIKDACPICKIFCVLLVIGGLNWGSIGVFGVNFVEAILGVGIITRVIYILVGLAAVAAICGCFCKCPKCKKS